MMCTSPTGRRRQFLTATTLFVSLLVTGALSAAPPGAAKTRGGLSRLKALRNKVGVAKGKLYGRSVALVLGIDAYAHMPKLDGAERDARRVAELFQKRGFQVRMLLGKQATRGAILAALEAVVEERLKPKDRLVVYFAGHGVSRQQSGGSMGFLMPVEAHPNKPISQGIEMAWLQRVVATEIKARHVLFIADACYSGLAIGHRGAPTSPKIPGYVRMIAQGRMRGALVAGTSGQQAHEFRGHGLFTYYLLQGMRGAADTQKPFGVVTSQELASYVRGHVTEQAAVHGWQQTPQYRGEGEGEFLFFVGGSGKLPKGLRIEVSTAAQGRTAAGAAPALDGVELGLGGVALLGAGAAVTFALLASQAADRYERYAVAGGKYLLPDSYTDQAFLNDVGVVDSRRTLAWASGGLAGASLVGLAVHWLLRRGATPRSAAITLTPHPRGAGLMVRF